MKMPRALRYMLPVLIMPVLYGFLTTPIMMIVGSYGTRAVVGFSSMINISSALGTVLLNVEEIGLFVACGLKVGNRDHSARKVFIGTLIAAAALLAAGCIAMIAAPFQLAELFVSDYASIGMAGDMIRFFGVGMLAISVATFLLGKLALKGYSAMATVAVCALLSIVAMVFCVNAFRLGVGTIMIGGLTGIIFAACYVLPFALVPMQGFSLEQNYEYKMSGGKFEYLEAYKRSRNG